MTAVHSKTISTRQKGPILHAKPEAGLFAFLALLGLPGNSLAVREYPKYVLYEVSSPIPALKKDELVKAFDIEVRGDVFSINLPSEWYVNVDKSIGGRVEIQGSIVVGADALAGKYLRYFNDFMVVAHEYGDPKYSGSYFNITIKFAIVSYPSEDTREVTIGLKDLKLKAWRAPAAWRDWVGNIQAQ